MELTSGEAVTLEKIRNRLLELSHELGWEDRKLPILAEVKNVEGRLDEVVRQQKLLRGEAG